LFLTAIPSTKKIKQLPHLNIRWGGYIIFGMPEMQIVEIIDVVLEGEGVKWQASSGLSSS